jgi:hypothetical protein
VSHLLHLSGGDARGGLIATLGSDFQPAIAPIKAEMLAIARYLSGDVHRAAMRLLVERDGRRPCAIEQQLIIAALAELQQASGGEASTDPFARAAAKCVPAVDSTHRRQSHALQVH